jgi:hypothetical protein
MSWRREHIDTIVAMMEDFNDDAFVMAVLQVIRDPEEEANPGILFHPVVLQRLKRIRRENFLLFAGRFLPGLRKERHVYIPDMFAAMTALPQEVDPFVWRDAARLLDEPVQPVAWLLDGLIAEGLTILGGTPKSGKSYLAYSLALAVAQYGQWLQHWEVATGTVVFVSLEDDESDTRQRLHELDPGLQLAEGRLRFIHGVDNVPTFEEGLLQWVHEVCEQHAPRLLVIDPLSYLYAPSQGKGNDLFTEMRQMVFPLRWLAKKHHCAIVALDHRRKRSRDDVNIFDTLHGSIAKQAVADALLMVERQEEELTLAALVRRGKDATHHLTMQFRDGQCWLQYKGQASGSGNYGDMRQKVYQTLMQYRIPLSIKEIMAEMDLPDSRQMYQQVHKICMRGVKDHELERTTRGAFVMANTQEDGRYA